MQFFKLSLPKLRFYGHKKINRTSNAAEATEPQRTKEKCIGNIIGVAAF
jgi:hypothetical protein